MTAEQLLIEWGFEKYVDVFKDNEVDLSALQLLDDVQVRELIPAIGPQAKFKKALSDWKDSLKKREEALQTDADLDQCISIYEESADGLTLSLMSPVQSLPASPSCSTRSASSASVCSHTQFDLSLLLESTPDGKLLLTHNKKNTLGEQYRKILVRAISKEILRNNPKANVTADTYLSWLQEIKRLFPSENLECYYTKPKAGLHRAHGRLFDAVTNLKAKYRKHKVYEPRVRRTLSPKPSTSKCNQDPITQEEEECLEWLRSSCDDYALCAEKWHRTGEQRKQRVLSNENVSYLQEFPCLKRSWGYELLISDFDRWYPNNEHSFDDKLPLLKSKLHSISINLSRQSPFVEELKQLVQDQDPETSYLAALLLIPHMIGPVYIKRKRISAAEVRQSFIVHVEEEKQVLEERLKRQDKYKSLGLTIQPKKLI